MSPRGKTQPAARERAGHGEAYTAYFRKKGEPQTSAGGRPRAGGLPGGNGLLEDGTEAVVWGRRR